MQHCTTKGINFPWQGRAAAIILETGLETQFQELPCIHTISQELQPESTTLDLFHSDVIKIL